MADGGKVYDVGTGENGVWGWLDQGAAIRFVKAWSLFHLCAARFWISNISFHWLHPSHREDLIVKSEIVSNNSSTVCVCDCVCV